MEPGRWNRVNLIWALGGLYLLYTGCEMLYRLFAGEAEMRAVSGVGGLFFLLVGCLMLWREWKAFQVQKGGLAGREDPEDGEGGETP